MAINETERDFKIKRREIYEVVADIALQAKKEWRLKYQPKITT